MAALLNGRQDFSDSEIFLSLHALLDSGEPAMSSTETMTDVQIERQALEVLGREPGVDWLARFLRLHRR